MPARPGDWSLITDDGKDPVAGDPDAVRTQAGYYGTMAQTIIKEAHRLKTLGADDELIGKYAKSLKSELSDLADQVHKAHKRYDGVHKALKPYATALDTAKTKSLAALKDAEAAHMAQVKANGSPNPQATPGGKPLTEAQKTQAKNHGTAVTTANGHLTDAKTKLTNALNDLNTAGKTAAGIINDHDDDSLKDHHHWWDAVVKIIKVIVEIANYVVIVLAIVALFVPGLDLIILAISVGILLTDTLLAATGNGSWTDVIIDAVSVATLGLGGGLGGKLAKMGEREATETIAAATKVATKAAFKDSGNFFMRNFIGRGGKMARAMEEGPKAVDRVLESVTVSGKDAWLAGGRELGKFDNQIDALSKTFGVGKLTTRLYMKSLRIQSAALWHLGVGVVTANTLLSKSNIPGIENIKPYSHDFQNFKDSNLSYHTPLTASDYDWHDHPAMARGVDTAIFGPVVGPEVASIGG